MSAHSAAPASDRRLPWIVWLGLAVVLAAAAILSFAELRALGTAVGIPTVIAWLLPISIDAGAAVSCAVWLGGRTDEHAARYAGRMTWALLLATVLGNATGLGLAAAAVVPPWWVAVLVGAIPPAIVGSTVHLVVLLVRRSDRGPMIQTAPDQQSGARPAAQVDEDELLPKVRELIAAQNGPVSQRKVRSEFGIGAERARALLEAAA